MKNWIVKYLLTAVVAVGALMECTYCTAILATVFCVTVADYLGELRARQHQTMSATAACRSVA